MTAIAQELDEKLRTLDADATSALEKLVRDALELVQLQNGPGKTAKGDRLPPDFFTKIAGEFGSEPFERPAQGEFEKHGQFGQGV